MYEAAASFAPLKENEAPVVELKEGEEQSVRPLTCCSLRNFPLAIKMMWNFGVGGLSPRPRGVLAASSVCCPGHVCPRVCAGGLVQ